MDHTCIPVFTTRVHVSDFWPSKPGAQFNLLAFYSCYILLYIVVSVVILNCKYLPVGTDLLARLSYLLKGKSRGCELMCGPQVGPLAPKKDHFWL